jgi:ubiquinone/menaquinone biosynthesis C-methylase UbiE
VGPRHRVLDVATGTGVAAEAAIEAVGRSGAVVATDLSPAMLEKARGRLSEKLNVSLAVEDGQSLTFPDQQFDAVLCAMGLMLFPDPARGLSEFRCVVREGRWAAVSVIGSALHGVNCEMRSPRLTASSRPDCWR